MMLRHPAPPVRHPRIRGNASFSFFSLRAFSPNSMFFTVWSFKSSRETRPTQPVRTIKRCPALVRTGTCPLAESHNHAHLAFRIHVVTGSWQSGTATPHESCESSPQYLVPPACTSARARSTERAPAPYPRRCQCPIPGIFAQRLLASTWNTLWKAMTCSSTPAINSAPDCRTCSSGERAQTL